MGGGRDKNGVAIYRRVNGAYVRRDGKPIKRRVSDEKAFTDLTPTARAAMSPLPKTGREVKAFFQKMLATENINDKWSQDERNQHLLYQKLADGSLKTKNGGFIFQDNRDKNVKYLKYNNMPDYKEVLKQVIPQLTPQNLRRVIPGKVTPVIDGKPEPTNLWEFETFVTNNNGDRIRTYVKIYPIHSKDGIPYAILVGLHRTAPMINRATAAQRG